MVCFSHHYSFQEEQFRMKKELADLAITLNMEAHKTRQTEAENNKQLAHTSKKDIQVDIVYPGRHKLSMD